MSNGESSKAGNEFFKHTERSDGTRDLFYGKISDSEHGHAVIDPNGIPKFIRESDGRIIADDSK